MMLVPTPAGKETGKGERARVVEEIESLRQFTVGTERPFGNLVVYHYAINMRGLEYEEVAPQSLAATKELTA